MAAMLDCIWNQYSNCIFPFESQNLVSQFKSAVMTFVITKLQSQNEKPIDEKRRKTTMVFGGVAIAEPGNYLVLFPTWPSLGFVLSTETKL